MNKRLALLSAIGFTFVLLAMLSISLTAQATPSENAPAQPQAILVSDDFNYGTTAGNLTAVSAGNWVSHSGTSGPVGYITTSLSMAGYGSSGVGGAATVSTSGVEDVNRSFTNQTSGTVYFAALVNVSTAGAGTYFLHLKDSGTINFRARVFARNDGGILRFGLSDSSTGAYSTAVFTYNTTYLVVVKYSVGTGDSALYVLDTFNATEPTTALLSTTGTAQPVQAVAIRQASGGPSAIIDGVRVANTWAEVVGYVPPLEADLSVRKTGPSITTPGETITYTISLSNTGTATATSTVITDDLPGEISFVTTTVPLSFTQLSPTQLRWNIGDVAPGANLTIQVQGIVTSNVANGTSFTNTATTSTAFTETSLVNNTATAATIVRQADLIVSKIGPAVVLQGDSITYTINISNTGYPATTDLVVTDTLPNYMAYITDTAGVNPVIAGPNVYVWNLSGVAAGSARSLKLTVSLSSTAPFGVLTNTVDVATNSIEENINNNRAVWPTTVGGTDLVVVKQGPTTALPGETITYTLSVSNNGNMAATNVWLTDTLPAKTSYITDSLGGSNTQNGQAYGWLLNTLAAGNEVSFTVTAAVSSSVYAGDLLTNTARVVGSEADGNLANNLATVTTLITGADPFVLKSGPAQVFGGDVMSYTITYGNYGNVPADVTITDTLPLSFTIIGDNSGWSAVDTANTRSWTTTIPANTTGLSFTLAVKVPLSVTTGTRVTNTVVVATSAAGNNPNDDSAQVGATVYQFTSIHDIQYVNDPDISDTSAYSGTYVAVQGVVIASPSSFLSAGGLKYRYYIEDPAGGPWSGLYIYKGTASLLPNVDEGDFVRLYGLLTEFVQGGSQQTELDLSKAGAFQQVVSTGNPVPAPFVLTTSDLINAGTAEPWESVLIEFQKSRVTNPNILNGEWNFDDGTGAAIGDDNAKTGGNTIFTYVPQLNDHYAFIRGIGWQSFGTYKIEPRYNADVLLDYPVTFTYNDLENVVQPSEEVQLRGDFTSWGTNPITLSHDVGYAVFSATVTLPTTATQNYKYYASSVGDPLASDLLNTDNRSLAPTRGMTTQNDYRNVIVGGGNLNGPASQTISLGSPTSVISGQLYVQSVTAGTGAGRGLKAEIGYGVNANPASWSWSGMSYSSENGNNDVYSGVFTPTAGGVYSYAARYNGNWGVGNPHSVWVYADLDGIPFSLDQVGVLTVHAPQLSITKTVATAHPIVNLGEVVTYTFTLSNSGDGAATGVLITDVLPGEITFGGFITANGATINGNTIGWSGTLGVSTQVQVVFTSTLGVNTTYLGRMVTNTVSMTANNVTGKSASATLSVANPPDFSASTKTSLPGGIVKPGALITYTIVLSNNGQTAATVFLTDVLNSYYTVSNVGDFTQSPTGTLKWNGTIAAGSSVTLFFVAQVKSLANLPVGVTPLTNSATLNDGLHAPYHLTDATPPSVKVYGIYVPLIKR